MGPDSAPVARGDGAGQVLFADLTTIGVGGPAGTLVEVTDAEALRCALAGAREEGVPLLVMGGGSNLVVSDEGFAGTVARIAIKGCRARHEGEFAFVEVGAGEDWWGFVRYCIAEGLSGVECLAGIPGLAGATPVQNVGAYGQEVSQVIVSVTVWDTLGGHLRRLTPAECAFGYRTSVMKRSDRFVVMAVAFRLRRSSQSAPLRHVELAEALGARLGERPPLAETAAAVVELRRRKGMVIDRADPDTRSAGSFFVNPILSDDQMSELSEIVPGVPGYRVTAGTKVPAAWLVERAGFPRGFRLGGAAISSKHALAITTEPGASARDVLALARRVRDGVARHFGVRLEPEPVLVGMHL